MATKPNEYQKYDFRILNIIRDHPACDAVELQAHGLTPHDASRLRELKTRGQVVFKSGGWYLTDEGDLFLLTYWDGPVVPKEIRDQAIALGLDPSKIDPKNWTITHSGSKVPLKMAEQESLEYVKVGRAGLGDGNEVHIIPSSNLLAEAPEWQTVYVRVPNKGDTE
jgi:hypothetical protein